MTETTYTAPADPVYDPAVLLTQLEDLPVLTDAIIEPLAAAVAAFTATHPRGYARVVVVGDGDSYIAGQATDLAFRRIAAVDYAAISAQRFLDYTVDWMERLDADPTLVVGVSASGSTERVSQALRRARERGITTLAVAGKTGLLSAAAESSILVSLPDGPRSPGVRTFHGSCLALYLLAIELGEQAGRHDAQASRDLRDDLVSASAATSEALSVARELHPVLLEWVGDSPVLAILGSGPSYGTALYAAAKLVETAGVLAFAQDLEEWHHVERFAYPLDMPVFVIAPSGRATRRATEVAGEAVQLGRRTILVAPAEAPVPEAVPLLQLRVPAGVREEFSPLVFHVGLTGLAAVLGAHRGRHPFQADVPPVPQSGHR